MHTAYGVNPLPLLVAMISEGVVTEIYIPKHHCKDAAAVEVQ